MKKMLIILLLLCFVLPTAQAAEGEKVLRVPADVSFVSEEDETAFRAAIEAAFAQRQLDVQIQWVEAHGDTDVIAAGSGLYTVEVNGERTNSLAVLEPLLFNLAEDEEIAANLAHFVGLSAVYGDGEGAVYYLPWSVTQSPWRIRHSPSATTDDPLGEELMTALEWDGPEEGWLWADFFDLCDRLEAYNAQAGTDYAVFAASHAQPALLRQALARDGEAVDETTVALAERWRAATEAGLLLQSENGDASDLEPLALLSQTPLGYGEFTGTISRHVPAPAFAEGETVYLPMDTAGLAVLKDSPKLDWALDFLACLTDPQFHASFAGEHRRVLDLGYLLRDAQDVLNTQTLTIVHEADLDAWQACFALARGWHILEDLQATQEALAL